LLVSIVTQAKVIEGISINIVDCNNLDRQGILWKERTILSLDGKVIKPKWTSKNTINFKRLKYGTYDLQIHTSLGTWKWVTIKINDSTEKEMKICTEISQNPIMCELIEQLSETDTLRIYHIRTSCMSGEHVMNCTLRKHEGTYLLSIDCDKEIVLSSDEVELVKMMLSELYASETSIGLYNATVVVLLGDIGFVKASDFSASTINYYLEQIE
jgi:hypothetical protein